MKILKILIAIVVVLLIVFAVLAPIGPVPGFFIGGTATAAPADWPDSANVHEIKLKVSGGIPRTVIIWVAEYEDELYVVGDKNSGWVSKIGEGSPVEMNLEGKTYSLTAERVTENWQAPVVAWREKYEPDYPEIIAGFPKLEEAGDTVRVYRLSRG